MSTKAAERVTLGAATLPAALLLLFSGGIAVSSATDRPWFWTVFDVTIPEAVLLRDAGEVVRLIGAGADVNEMAPVRAGIEGDRELDLLPLEAAVAAKDIDILQMLLSRGATLDERLRQRLLCFAGRVEAASITTALTLPDAPHPNCENIATPW